MLAREGVGQQAARGLAIDAARAQVEELLVVQLADGRAVACTSRRRRRSPAAAWCRSRASRRAAGSGWSASRRSSARPGRTMILPLKTPCARRPGRPCRARGWCSAAWRGRSACGCRSAAGRPPYRARSARIRALAVEHDSDLVAGERAAESARSASRACCRAPAGPACVAMWKALRGSPAAACSGRRRGAVASDDFGHGVGEVGPGVEADVGLDQVAWRRLRPRSGMRGCACVGAHRCVRDEEHVDRLGEPAPWARWTTRRLPAKAVLSATKAFVDVATCQVRPSGLDRRASASASAVTTRTAGQVADEDSSRSNAPLTNTSRRDDCRRHQLAQVDRDRARPVAGAAPMRFAERRQAGVPPLPRLARREALLARSARARPRAAPQPRQRAAGQARGSSRVAIGADRTGTCDMRVSARRRYQRRLVLVEPVVALLLQFQRQLLAARRDDPASTSTCTKSGTM